MLDFDTRFEDMKASVPFSKSPFWALLREYYEEQGPKAWCGSVPSYVTNNTSLAVSYAELLIAYYQDWVTAHGQTDKPLYIFELGSGSGRFGFYLLKALERSCSLHGLDPNSFRLILSDLAKKNIESWVNHKSMKPFFEAGQLDCIQYDLQKKANMVCRYSGRTMSVDDFVIPPFVLSHYVLDSLPIDLFHVENKELSATHIALAKERFSEKRRKNDIRQYHLVPKDLKIKHNYYQNDTMQALLDAGARQVVTGYFNLPVTAVKMLQRLKEQLGGRMVFSCLDKGMVDWTQYSYSVFPSVFYHGNTFSMDVNFAALDHFIEQDELSFELIKTYHQALKWMVYGMGFQLTERQAINRYLYHYTQKNNALDYYHVYRSMLETSFDQSISALLALLSQSAWDPILFCQIAPRLAQLIPDASLENWVVLLSSVELLEDNFIHLADSPDFYLHLGQILYLLEDFPRSIDYLKKSREAFGDSYANLYAQGRSYFSAGDTDKSATLFALAQKKRATKQVTGWMKYFKQKAAKKTAEKKKPADDSGKGSAGKGK